MFAHAVGVSDVSAVVTGKLILETFQNGALFVGNTGELF